MEREERAYSLLKEIGFVRTGGSDEELKAANIIIDRLKENGIKGKLESFEVQSSEISEAHLEITKPYKKTVNCTAYMCCKDTDAKGLKADLLYYEDNENEVLKKQAEGKVLLVNGYMGQAGFKKIYKDKPAAFITYNGHIDYTEKFDLDQREFRDTCMQYGSIPGVNIKVEDAMEMVERGASEVKIVTKQTTKKIKSHNVVVDIDGWENKERIVCTAHYDSVPFSKGYYDNGTGSVCLYEMALYFAKNQPKHHMTFVWCGSEERGLLGSKAYCAKHEKKLDDVRLVVNIDMVGSIMGKRIAVSTAPQALVDYIDYYGKIKGFPIKSSQGVYSSDSTPFADKGIPAVSFARITASGTGDIHSRNDVLEHLSPRLLKEDIDFICDFTDNMANSFTIPVKKEMPDNMKKELDKYLCREDKPSK